MPFSFNLRRLSLACQAPETWANPTYHDDLIPERRKLPQKSLDYIMVDGHVDLPYRMKLEVLPSARNIGRFCPTDESHFCSLEPKKGD